MSPHVDYHENQWPERLRRRDASEYLRKTHGLELAPTTWAKLAVTGGGPEYDLWGRIPYYPIKKLDEWVMARLSRRRSISDRGSAERVAAAVPEGTPQAHTQASCCVEIDHSEENKTALDFEDGRPFDASLQAHHPPPPSAGKGAPVDSKRYRALSKFGKKSSAPECPSLTPETCCAKTSATGGAA
jgi:hypothetical protein